MLLSTVHQLFASSQSPELLNACEVLQPMPHVSEMLYVAPCPGAVDSSAQNQQSYLQKHVNL